jgi:hypothetical protein
MQPVYRAPMAHAPDVVIEAAADYWRHKENPRAENVHPLARSMGSSDIAKAFAHKHTRVMDHHRERNIVALGMGTSQFAQFLADGQMTVVSTAYSAQAAHHLEFCTEIPVKDFRPCDIVGPLDPIISLEPIGQGGEIQQFQGAAFQSVEAGGNVDDARLTSFGRIVGFSEDAIINDSLGATSRFIAELAISAARLESSMVCSALMSNPVDKAGAAIFDAARGNVLTEALDKTTLGQAVSMLRMQSLPNGHPCDLSAKHLVVSASLELAARELVNDAGMDLAVRAMAYMPAGRWVLLADHRIQPVVGVLRLKGSPQPVSVSGAKKKISSDATYVRVTADLGALMLGSIGIVRGGTVA